MKTGIDAIDSVVGDLPSCGVITVIGSGLYQSAIVKAIGLSLGTCTPGIVVSTEFARWETRDVAKTHLLIMDSNDATNSLELLAACRNLKDYKLIILDNIPSRSNVFTKTKIESALQQYKSNLVIISIHGSSIIQGYDIESFLVCQSDLTFKVSESTEKDKVKLSIYGRYLVERKIHTEEKDESL